MALKPPTKDAMDLLMKGTTALTRMSNAGVRVDVGYLNNVIKETTQQISEMEHEIRNNPIVETWKKHYGKDFKLGSRTQLGRIVFDILGNKRNPFMGGMNNEIAFKHLKDPFTAPDGPYFGIAKLKKALSTYLIGLKNHTVNGFIHPSMKLFSVESYRSSCTDPNLQNQPRRNKRISEIVRRSIIARDGHDLIEADYSAQEVRVGACYCKDPQLISYVTGGGDQHFDAAKDIYMLTDGEIGGIEKGQPGRDVRDITKNKWVFPQNYGSYYLNCTPDLWEAIEEWDLKTAQGVSLFHHLKSKGIKRMGACDPDKEPVKGTFEHHVREAERAYWERLSVFAQWRKDWWQLYQDQGGLNTLTGFRMAGKFSRNQVLCDPIQGSAFHCLLWSIINIQNEMIRKKMKSQIVLQIHDSILFDAHRREVDDLVEITRRWAIDKVAKHWPWIIVPLAVEFERSESTWFDKDKMAI